MRNFPWQLEQKAVEERIELYYAAHPGGPAAVRRPRVTKRGALWVALLGPNMQQGIVGIGSTVEMALRTFDVQYMERLHPMAA
jgi:hypothetical protein